MNCEEIIFGAGMMIAVGLLVLALIGILMSPGPSWPEPPRRRGAAEPEKPDKPPRVLPPPPPPDGPKSGRRR